MNRKLVILAASTLLGAMAAAGTVMSQDAGPALGEGQGWTGVTDPAGVIAARLALMSELEQLIMPIDFYTAGDPGDLDVMRANAESIARLLTIVPHLFPPTTNIYDPDDPLTPTVALPTIWENFDAFTATAMAASAVALEASTLTDPEAFRAAGLAMRDTCAACHDPFMRAYVPPSFDPADLGALNLGIFN